MLHLKGKNETLTSDAIKFLKGIFQGDSLSVLLFILTVNPLSFMLRNIKGYSYWIKRANDITHNFFVDDLKLYACNINITKKQLDLLTTISEDTEMIFGEDKYAYQQVVNGKLIKNTDNLKINNLNIKPIKDSNNANSPTSGESHPHFKVFIHLSKQLPFHLHFCLTKHINK